MGNSTFKGFKSLDTVRYCENVKVNELLRLFNFMIYITSISIITIFYKNKASFHAIGQENYVLGGGVSKRRKMPLLIEGA